MYKTETMDLKDYTVEHFLTDESFLNYCTGKTSTDMQFWESWLADHPEKRGLADEAKEFFLQLQDELNLERKTQKDLSDFKRVFSDHIRSPDELSARKKTKSLTDFRTRTLLGIAATLVIVLSIVFLSGILDRDAQTGQLSQVKSLPQNSTKTTLTLPDGSKVTLNPNSRIVLAKDFNSKQRILTLEGEAFFEVVKDPNKPFVVRAGTTTTTALGTSFMVRYYDHEDRVKVSLLTGKVKVEQIAAAAPEKKAVVLTPGLEVVVNRRTAPGILEKHAFEPEILREWKLDQLTFSDAEFNEIVNKIGEWFGVKVVVRNAPPTVKHFTGKFKNENLETVIEALSFAHKFNYQIKPDTVIIQFKPTP
jgi:transmembrane sensor